MEYGQELVRLLARRDGAAAVAVEPSEAAQEALDSARVLMAANDADGALEALKCAVHDARAVALERACLGEVSTRALFTLARAAASLAAANAARDDWTAAREAAKACLDASEALLACGVSSAALAETARCDAPAEDVDVVVCAVGRILLQALSDRVPDYGARTYDVYTE